MATRTATSKAAVATGATEPTDAKAAGLDLDALAADSKEIAALPAASSRAGSGGNAFTALVQRSAAEGKPFATPVIPAEMVVRAQYAIRRAGKAVGLTVTTRVTRDASGAVINFQAVAGGSKS
jgi:hypothetical protein